MDQSKEYVERGQDTGTARAVDDITHAREKPDGPQHPTRRQTVQPAAKSPLPVLRRSSGHGAGAAPRARDTVVLQQTVGNARLNRQPRVQAPDRRVKSPRPLSFVETQVALVRNAVEARADYDSSPRPLAPDEAGPPAPGGAFYYLNGLNPTDLSATLRAIGPGTRALLFAHLNLADGKFDRPRLELALRSVAWNPRDGAGLNLSLLDDIRNAAGGPLTAAFARLHGLARAPISRLLATLDRPTLAQLRAHAGEAPPADQATLMLVLDDLLGTPTMRADDVIDLAPLRGLDRTMADIYNTRGQYLAALAAELHISSATAAGIMKVESGGETFGSATNKPIVRLELHKLWHHWGHSHDELFNRHFHFHHPDKNWQDHRYRVDPTGPWQEYHDDQAREWAAVDFAAGLAGREATYRSMSIGAGQIMGENFPSVGYASAVEMVEAFSRSERAQIHSIFDFIRHDPHLVTAVQWGDFERLARAYNGPGQVAKYAAAIRDAAAAYTRVTHGKRHVSP